MVTRVFPVDPVSPSPRVIEEVAAILKRGGLVAFPTETVYGLGADGLDGEAVRRIFVAKGRPQDNPLILHVSGRGQVGRLVDFIPDAAELLMDAFWPGPLTLVLKKSGVVPDVVSAGLDSVAVRMPANAVASALISAVGRPLAAPSANLSGRPSPTAAEHVVEDLDGRVDAVLDGGV
ncbi:MAG: L-threonylcarbamoyladenylate synthase, partial [Candidatus Woesearchaeota archaeon]